MLTKMGWSEGTGLGAKRDGTVAPITVKKRPDSLGIGANRRQIEDPWWEKMMEDAYGKPETAPNPDDLLEACEGRRCRPHGTAKLARLEAHEKSNADDQKVPDAETDSKVLKKRKKGATRKSSKRSKDGAVSDKERHGRIRKTKRKSKKSKSGKSER